MGASGYVAPRYFKSIKETGNNMLVAFDSLGVIDNYFPNTDFFVKFDRHVDKLKRGGNGIDYLSVCLPNYLNDSNIRFGLKAAGKLISEKPLVLNS